jgi:hydroxyethylthiazole kinase-like uncharacterized protein yjeF
MKVSTAAEMKSIDRRAIREMGIPSLDLMERAGEAVAEVTEAVLGETPDPRVVIVSGRGNNGGDGFVTARALRQKGMRVEVVLAADPASLSPDAAVNRDRAREMGIPIHAAGDEAALGSFSDLLASADVVVDAILGTGVSGEVRELAKAAIEMVNGRARRVVAIDVPSGLDADTGLILGECVRAAVTVTLGLPKRGHLLMPGRSRVGRLAVADIGIPREAVEAEGIEVEVFDPMTARDLLPFRAPDAHKWTCGHAVLVAGSTGLTGAAALASEAALRAGAGLTTLCIPKSLNAILEVKVTETMTRPMPETEEGSLSGYAEAPILEVVRSASAVILGPGLSQVPETSGLVRSLVPRIETPLVVDADALNAYSGGRSFRHAPGVVPVLTPHLGELSRLTGAEKAEIAANRIESARRYARELDSVLLLKGLPTIVAHPSGRTSFNLTGSNALATAGSGDVLTGVIGGLLAQGLPPFDAARLGAHLHGAAGDLAAETYGFRSVIAGDVLEFLPQAILELEMTEDETGPLRWIL